MTSASSSTTARLPTLSKHLGSLLPGSERAELRDSVLPLLLSSITRIATILRTAHQVSQVGSANAFGDEQLNVDVLCEDAVREAIAACPAVVTASSEEDPVERTTRPPSPVHGAEITTTEAVSREVYTLAFDPLDGSSIIGSNWTIGTIIGIWDGASAVRQLPSTGQIGAILGVCGPRTSAIIALRLPGKPDECFEVALGGSEEEMVVLRPQIRFQSPPFKTRYFAPANLRAAAEDPKYFELINHYIKDKYTLRYSGGLVPDIFHSLTKGHGVFISPVTGSSKPKLRKLFELFPVALIVECAGGKAADPVSGADVLAEAAEDIEEKGGLICGTSGEVAYALQSLIGQA